MPTRWSQLIKPGEPLAVPQLRQTALRLTAAVLPKGATTGAQLSIQTSGWKTAAGAPFVLAKLRPAKQAAAASDAAAVAKQTASGLSAPLKLLLSCAQGAQLSASGGPLWVCGRLEGVEAAGAQATAAGEKSTQTSSSSKESSSKGAGTRRPKDEEEYLWMIEEYLWEKGRTPLRELGNRIRRPRGVHAGTLKDRLLKHRSRFLVDLSGTVEANRARRWRWGSQPAVSRARHRADGMAYSFGTSRGEATMAT
eukprot:TRINITY_DN33235_c0_g1_i1.p1 TRINITY_DN33235_c0_g1~~TRINITY_DN33235_c0_g1_i1.p1  ORF type:complete len:252 (+),score=49.55 TRINITY_DN33235_c0_g1_i1:70-825(+)